MKDFVSLIEKGLKNFNQQETLKTLGDRSQYVGSSDLGKCPLNIFWSKTQEIDYGLNQLLIFERGHNAEKIIENALNGLGIEFEQQKEVKGIGEFDFCKTHIDFYLPQESLIIEVKSTANFNNDFIWDSWNQQVQFQMGLLGVKKAVLVIIDLNKGLLRAEELNFNPTAFQNTLKNAKEIWEALNTNIPPKPQKCDLCGKCPFKNQCPAILAKTQEVGPDVENLVLETVKLSKEAKEIDLQLKDNKQLLIDFAKVTGINKISASGLTVEIKETKGRKSLDTELLKEFITKEDLEKCYKQGSPSFMVKII